MSLPLGTLVDPAAQQLNLRLNEFAICRRWRHLEAFLLGADSLEKPAFGSLAWNDDPITTAVGKCTFLGVESQSSLLRLLIGPMTGKTGIRKDWTNITIEVYGLGLTYLCNRSIAHEYEEKKCDQPREAKSQESSPAA